MKIRLLAGRWQAIGKLSDRHVPIVQSAKSLYPEQKAGVQLSAQMTQNSGVQKLAICAVCADCRNWPEGLQLWSNIGYSYLAASGSRLNRYRSGLP